MICSPKMRIEKRKPLTSVSSFVWFCLFYNACNRYLSPVSWLTREHLAEIYATTPQNISLHVGNIYQDQELSEEGTRKKFFLVRQEGKRQVKREIDHYNLDMIIALGYRVQSPIAVRFRRWATQRLHEYIQKGFTMDDERLKQERNR